MKYATPAEATEAIRNAVDELMKAVKTAALNVQNMQITERTPDSTPTLIDLIDDAEQCINILRGSEMISESATRFLVALDSADDRAYFAAFLTLHGLVIREAMEQLDSISDGLQRIFESGEAEE